jgi:hypothetical protein
MASNSKTFNDRRKCRYAMAFSTPQARQIANTDNPGLPSPAEWPPLRRFFTRHRDAKRIMDGFPAQAALQAAGGSCGRQLYRADAASNDRLTTNHESDKAYL